MSEQEIEVADEYIEPEPEATEEEEVSEEAPAEMSAEERAEAVGWNPNFDGPNARSAEEFLSRRDDNIGLLRTNVETLEKKIGEQNRTMETMSSFLTNAQRKAEEQGYQRALEEIRDRKVEAAEGGDADGVRQADADEDALREEWQQANQPPEPQPQQNPQVAMLRQKVQQYAADERNKPVFATRGQAQEWLEEMRYASTRGADLDTAFDTATRVIVNKYKLGNLPGPEDGGGGGGGGSRKGFASLPKEVKNGFYEFARKDPDMNTKEGQAEYAKVYYEEYGA